MAPRSHDESIALLRRIRCNVLPAVMLYKIIYHEVQTSKQFPSQRTAFFEIVDTTKVYQDSQLSKWLKYYNPETLILQFRPCNIAATHIPITAYIDLEHLPFKLSRRRERWCGGRVCR